MVVTWTNVSPVPVLQCGEIPMNFYSRHSKSVRELTLTNSFSANCLTFSSTTVPFVECRLLLDGTTGGESVSLSRLGTLFDSDLDGGGGGIGLPATSTNNKRQMTSPITCAQRQQAPAVSEFPSNLTVKLHSSACTRSEG